MKSKKEIEQLAKEEYPICSITSNTHQIIEKYERDAFTKGYTQCKEDIFNELNEWIVITLSAESKLGSPNSVIETLLSVKYKIESLNKQN